MIRCKILLREISLVAFLFIGVWSWVFAQPTIQWQKSFGGSYFDEAYCVKHTSDGGSIVVGTTASWDGAVFGQHGNSDYWIIKLKADGSLQWKKVLGGTGPDFAYYCLETEDGGYVVAGYAFSNDYDVSGNHGDFDGWVVKLNSVGAIQWQKSFGGSGWDTFWSIQPTSDNGFILVGRSTNADGDVTENHGKFDVWVVKIDHLGEIQWQKSFGGSEDDIGYAGQQTSDGGYIILGRTSSIDGDASTNNGNVDVWVLKLDSLGVIEWQKSFGGDGGDIGSRILQTDDDGFLFTSYVGSHDSGDISGNPDLSLFDYWVVKLSPQGDIQWQKALGGSGRDYARDVVKAVGGGYVVIGESESTDGELIGNIGLSDFWLVKLSESGDLVWQKNYGGTDYDFGFTIDNTTDGGYIMAGFAWSKDGDLMGSNNIGYNDYWIVKLSPDISSPTTEPGTDAMQIFPNPTAEAVQLKVPMDVGAIKVTITDLQGREVLKSEVENGGILSVKSLPNGVYQVAAMADDETIYFGKLEVIK